MPLNGNDTEIKLLQNISFSGLKKGTGAVGNDWQKSKKKN